MTYYLDACVVVALVQEEPGTTAAIQFVSEADDSLVVSDYALGEVASAISRQFRMGKIELPEAKNRLALLDEWVAGSAEPIATEPGDIRMGAQLVRRIVMGVRMPDAIHLAAAQTRGYRLVTIDRHMAMAAEQIGLETVLLG